MPLEDSIIISISRNSIPYTNLFRGFSFPEKLINAVVIFFHLLQTRRGSGCLRVTDREPDNGELAAISEQVNRWCLAEDKGFSGVF